MEPSPLDFCAEISRILDVRPRGLFLNHTYMTSIPQHIKETRAELKHVSWPTRRQAVLYTAAVVAISLITAAYLGGFDWLYGQLLEIIVL